MSGPQGSSTPAFVESQANVAHGDGIGGGGGGTQSANGKGKAPGPRTVPASFGKTKGSIWWVPLSSFYRDLEALVLRCCVRVLFGGCCSVGQSGAPGGIEGVGGC